MNVLVDLDSIRINIRKIKEYTKKDIICVLKSNAYGLGKKQIIKVLLKENIKYFFFNKLKEYLEVKELLNDKNVIIFEPLTIFDINKYYEENLILTINSYDDLLRYKNFGKKVRVHLQIDTGMNRVGIRTINECKKIIKNCPSNIEIDGIYTHFASSKDDQCYYEYQKSLFKEYLKLYDFKIIHACASSSLHKELIGNMVRIGMAMYGYGTSIKLTPSVFAYTKVINILNLDNNTSVGYESKYITKGYEQICLLDVGYFDSTLINKVYYNNKVYKFIGKTCMNHSYILIDNEINLLSRLSLLPKFGIIEEEYDFYKLLTSFSHLPKIYLERMKDYEIPYIFKQTSKKSIRCKSRKRSC